MSKSGNPTSAEKPKKVPAGSASYFRHLIIDRVVYDKARILVEEREIGGVYELLQEVLNKEIAVSIKKHEEGGVYVSLTRSVGKSKNPIKKVAGFRYAGVHTALVIAYYLTDYISSIGEWPIYEQSEMALEEEEHVKLSG